MKERDRIWHAPSTNSWTDEYVNKSQSQTRVPETRYDTSVDFRPEIKRKTAKKSLHKHVFM